MKISYLKEKLIFTAGYLVLVLALRWFGVPCIFKAVFGIPCPGCGMTRAFLAALRLDLAAAFGYHMMFWSMPILYAYFLLDKGFFRQKLWDGLLLGLIGAGFLVNWILNIIF